MPSLAIGAKNVGLGGGIRNVIPTYIEDEKKSIDTKIVAVGYVTLFQIITSFIIRPYCSHTIDGRGYGRKVGVRGRKGRPSPLKRKTLSICKVHRFTCKSACPVGLKTVCISLLLFFKRFNRHYAVLSWENGWLVVYVERDLCLWEINVQDTMWSYSRGRLLGFSCCYPVSKA